MGIAPDPLRPAPPKTREALARHLLAAGAISVIPPGRTSPPPRPITVQGKLRSERRRHSPKKQNFVAALVIENIQDTRQWDAQFAASKDVLEELFDEAVEEYQAGRTTPLNA